MAKLTFNTPTKQRCHLVNSCHFVNVISIYDAAVSPNNLDNHNGCIKHKDHGETFGLSLEPPRRHRVNCHGLKFRCFVSLLKYDAYSLLIAPSFLSTPLSLSLTVTNCLSQFKVFLVAFST